jgi:hypothetical protein
LLDWVLPEIAGIELCARRRSRQWKRPRRTAQDGDIFLGDSHP